MRWFILVVCHYFSYTYHLLWKIGIQACTFWQPFSSKQMGWSNNLGSGYSVVFMHFLVLVKFASCLSCVLTWLGSSKPYVINIVRILFIAYIISIPTVGNHIIKSTCKLYICSSFRMKISYRIEFFDFLKYDLSQC